jgi:hypothetical protein
MNLLWMDSVLKSTSIVADCLIVFFFCFSVFKTKVFVCLFGVEGCEANLSVGINCPRGLR